MYRASYRETVDEAASVGRARERELLDRLVARIEAVRERPADDPERLQALRLVQEVWRFFVVDLADDRNALPLALRADLVSIGLWIIREADRLIAGDAHDVSALVEIIATVRKGLE